MSSTPPRSGTSTPRNNDNDADDDDRPREAPESSDIIESTPAGGVGTGEFASPGEVFSSQKLGVVWTPAS